MEYNYKDLNLKTNTDTITFNFEGKDIEIFKYLPLEYKYDLIMSALNDSDEQGVYNCLKLDAYFHLNMFISYVKNITFSKEDLDDKLKLYNELNSSGMLDAFAVALNEREYEECFEALAKLEKVTTKYRNTLGAALRTFINVIPETLKEASEFIENLDEESLKKLTGLADSFKAAVPVKA